MLLLLGDVMPSRLGTFALCELAELSWELARTFGPHVLPNNRQFLGLPASLFGDAYSRVDVVLSLPL